MKHWLKIKYILPLVLIACGFIYYNQQKSATSAAVSEKLGEVKREDLVQRVTVAGVVTPNRRTAIVAPYEGYIQKIFVKVGDVVKQYDPIITVGNSLQKLNENYPIRAPFPGLVVQVNSNEGDRVDTASKTPMVRIDDLSKLFVVANTPEIDMAKLKVGQEAEIRVSAIFQKTYKGELRQIALAAQESTNGRDQVEFPIKMEIINPDSAIKPGMSVLADIITLRVPNVLTLRNEYIQLEDGKHFVTLSKGQKKKIEVGAQNDESFEIKSGLAEGEKVKVTDFFELSQGKK